MLEEIKKRIEERGLKHRWLADQVGVHPTTLSRFLTGKTNLSNAALKSLLKELKLEALLKKAS
ncbi:MAG: helix-turn-helix transcriptional regulator [Bdellovibrio sp.]